MRTFFYICLIALSVNGWIFIASCAVKDGGDSTGTTTQALEACGTTGDQDGDGIADAADTSQTDSCTATSTGFEDCATGAGDGIPDCE